MCSQSQGFKDMEPLSLPPFSCPPPSQVGWPSASFLHEDLDVLVARVMDGCDGDKTEGPGDQVMGQNGHMVWKEGL